MHLNLLCACCSPPALCRGPLAPYLLGGEDGVPPGMIILVSIGTKTKVGWWRWVRELSSLSLQRLTPAAGLRAEGFGTRHTWRGLCLSSTNGDFPEQVMNGAVGCSGGNLVKKSIPSVNRNFGGSLSYSLCACTGGGALLATLGCSGRGQQNLRRHLKGSGPQRRARVLSAKPTCCSCPHPATRRHSWHGSCVRGELYLPCVFGEGLFRCSFLP